MSNITLHSYNDSPAGCIPQERTDDIKERCKTKGLTQEKMAELLGVSRQVVGYWLNGTTSLPSKRLNDICDLIGVDIDYLFGRIDEPTHAIKEASNTTGLSPEAIEVLQTLKVDKSDFNVSLINEILTGIYNSDEYKQLQAGGSDWLESSVPVQMPISIFNYMYQFLHCGGAKLYHKEKDQFRESSAYNEAYFRIPGEYQKDKKGNVSAAYGKKDSFFGVDNASDLYKTHLGNKIMMLLEKMKEKIESSDK